MKGQSEENIVKALGLMRHLASFEATKARFCAQVLEVLPRVYPLVLGELEPRPPAAKTQGKAGNQLGALRFLPATFHL